MERQKHEAVRVTASFYDKTLWDVCGLCDFCTQNRWDK